MPGQLWRELLDEAWAAAAGDLAQPELEVTGEAGQLPSRLAAEDMAIACAGSALLAGAAFGQVRGGPASRLARLDRPGVAAAFRSERYLRVGGQPSGDGFAPLSRFWPAANGFVRTHANYPWHREALLRALGCAPDPAAVAATIAGHGAAELESRIVAAGGIAAAVRGSAEWLASAPGHAAGSVPLITESRIGDAPARSRAPAALPAEGIRVLDLTRVIAGPVATRYLAALGADVLRIDPPSHPELPLHAADGLLGKRSALADFGTPDGLRTLHDLLDGADVLVHGYRPHALERFGLAPDALADRHPGLVSVSLSAWGDRGPWGDRRGFDSIVQAASGIAVAEGSRSAPGVLPCQLLDHGTGYLCAASALGALAAQQAEGGTHVRTLSLARTSRWLLAQPAQEPGPAIPAADVPAADGPWLCTVGPVTTVLPPGELDGRGLSWRRPVSRYGTDAPAWN